MNHKTWADIADFVSEIHAKEGAQPNRSFYRTLANQCLLDLAEAIPLLDKEWTNGGTADDPVLSGYAITLPADCAQVDDVVWDDGQPIDRLTKQDMDLRNPDWRNDTGEPTAYCIPDNSSILLNSTPSGTTQGCITAINATPPAGGEDYDVGDILSITQSPGAGGKVRVAAVSDSPTNGVTTILGLYAAGSGYSAEDDLPTVKITGGGNDGCTVEILAVDTLNANGKLAIRGRAYLPEFGDAAGDPNPLAYLPVGKQLIVAHYIIANLPTQLVQPANDSNVAIQLASLQMQAQQATRSEHRAKYEQMKSELGTLDGRRRRQEYSY